jgi:hypothetical protein
VTRIEVEEIGYGSRGAVYSVMHAGKVLIDAVRTRVLDAARALLAKGITGRLEVWHGGAAFPAMILDTRAGRQGCRPRG